MGALVGAWIALVTIPGDSIPRRRMAEGMAAAVLFLSLIQITANKFVLQIDEVAHHLAKAPPVDPSTSFCTVIM